MDMPTHINANPLATGNDELECYSLEECYGRRQTDHRAWVLVMPTGSCEMAIRFSRFGADVVVCDSPGGSQDVERRGLLSLHSELGRATLNSINGPRNAMPRRSPAPAKRWGISSAVCLCGEHTFFMLLEAGASVLRTMTTIHGSVKSVAVRV
jgi:hypothetical protein